MALTAPNQLATTLPDPDSDQPTVVVIESDGPVDEGEVDPESGALVVRQPDGGAVISLFGPSGKDAAAGTFDENLAEKIEPMERGRIGAELVELIRSDDESRREWLETRAKGLEMLGFKIEDPRGDTGTSSAPVEGMATVRHTALAEAVIRFQSNASAELLPAGGPVKVTNYGAESDEADDLAEALQNDFNYYLTVADKGYRADTDRALFSTGFGGCAFKKIYKDPIRRMPLSRTVDAADLIVSNNVNEFEDAGRVTHRIIMRPSVLRRMQLAGAYRDVPLSQPHFQANTVEEKKNEISGFDEQAQRPEDMPYTIYECYCELDIRGYEHKDQKGQPSRLPVPYRVVLDKDSGEVLEIRRNWREDDPLCLPKRVFVKYPFVPAFGFYEIGLLQIIGNAEKALTGAWRLALDNSMFANFPGWLYADVAGRQVTNEFRVAPGAGVKIQTGGEPIQNMVMPLPYTSAHMGPLMTLTQQIQEQVQRVAGTAELPVGEGRQDAPVGTTLALIEQATKMLASVHVRLHAAQAEEFQLLKELFRDDPGALWRGNRRPCCPWAQEIADQDAATREQATLKFLQALENHDLVPAADPNISSHMHRIMKAVAVKQLQAMNPQLYDAQKVDLRIMKMIGITDAASLFVPPQPPMDPNAAGVPVDPNKQAALALKAQEMQSETAMRQQDAAATAASKQAQNQARMAEISVESQDRAADRASRERVAARREQTQMLKLVSDMLRQGAIDPQTAMALMQSMMAGQTPH